MVVSKETEYTKTYYSIRGETNTFNNNFSQITCKEDNKLRCEIQKKFDVKGTNGMGYDGRVLYRYDIGSNLGPQINVEKSQKYKTTCRVKKSGRLEDLNKNCDLEDFLLKKGFKKV